MGLRVSRDEKKEIVSKKSLLALHELINFLKNNVGAEGLFAARGQTQRRRKILAILRRGDHAALRQLLREGSGGGAHAVVPAVECAAALQAYLAHLRPPLIPARVQKLVLAENAGVPEGRVASDALGLLAQELSGRHLELLAALLDLLHAATRASGQASELRGCRLPVLLLPVFFDLQPSDLVRWRRVASTFDEVISTAPHWMREFQRNGAPPPPPPPATRQSHPLLPVALPPGMYRRPWGHLEEQQMAVLGRGMFRLPVPPAAPAPAPTPDVAPPRPANPPLGGNRPQHDRASQQQALEEDVRRDAFQLVRQRRRGERFLRADPAPAPALLI